MKKRIFACLIVLALVLQTLCVGAFVYSETQTEEIAEGITRTTVREFYGSAWTTYHVVTADLSAPNVSMRVLTSPSGVSYLDNVMTMAKDTDIVAAINADFFDTSIGNGRSSMLGLTVQDGELTSSASVDPNLAAMAQTDDGRILMDYFRTFLYAFTPDGISQEIAYVNKYHSTAALSMYTSAWGETSRGSQGNMIELVCAWDEEEEGTATVLEKHLGSPAVTIPKNGFVLRTDNSINGYLNDNFNTGDKIRITVAFMPDEGKLEEAVGGGSLLVKDGKKAAFTNVISGTHPRSAVGVSRDGQTLYLVAVDGRQSRASGMTQDQLANLMLSLGAHTALNLDGGGSTTMVERNFFDGGLTVTNTPSDGALRRVSSSIGIASSYDGTLSALRVRANDAVFAGTGIKLAVMGLDKYKNPVVLPPDAEIEWSVTGVEGEFENDVFYPSHGGTAEITASYKDVTGTIEVEVHDEIFSLEPSQREFRIPVGGTKAVSLTGYDSAGNSAPVRAQDVEFYAGDLAEIEDGKIKGLTEGYGTAAFATDDVQSFVSLIVGDVSSQEAEDFETLNGTFASYPEGVTGEYTVAPNSEIAKTQLGRLDFVFEDLTKASPEPTEPPAGEAAEDVPVEEAKDVPTRAAYFVYDTPLTLPDNIAGLDLLVHSKENKPVSVKAYLSDTDGEIHYVTLADSIGWTGWKTLSADLPDTLSGGKLERIYVVYTGTEEVQGTIYMDDLNFLLDVDVDIPEDITKKDTRNVAAEVAPGGFEFYVMATNSKNDTLLNIQAQGILSKKFTPDTAYGVYLGGFVHQNLVPEGTQAITTSANSRIDHNDATFLTVGGGFSANTWEFLSDNLSDAQKNIFVLLKQEPTGDNRTVLDSLLGQCADDGHNVMVFYEGGTGFMIRNGVRYFSLTSAESVNGANTTEKLRNQKAIAVRVNPDRTTYEYVPFL